MYMIFKELLDTNKDGTVEYDEAMSAVEAYCTGEGKGTCEDEEFEKDLHELHVIAEQADREGNKDGKV